MEAIKNPNRLHMQLGLSSVVGNLLDTVYIDYYYRKYAQLRLLSLPKNNC